MSDCDLFALATKGVQALSPYQPGKPIDELEREYGVSDVIKLASNENPLGPSAKVITAIQHELTELSRYPDGNGFSLKNTLANMHSVAIEQITLGNGSNDILEILTRAFVTPEHEVVFSQHAFAVYPIVTQAVGAKAVVVPAKNWGHDLEAMQEAITDKTRVVFIANPNNPTGTWLDKQVLSDFLQAVPDNVLVVLDEAYFEFAHSDPLAKNYPNGIELLSQYSNLIVTRTFSKAYGLAGLRVGYSVSDTQVADALNRVRQPFNVNSLALKAAEVALKDSGYLEAGIKLNAQGMSQLITAFGTLNLNYIPSVANFICVEVGENAMKVYDDLLYEGVIVRPVANYEMPRYLRITIGTEKENERFINALRKVLNQ
ncbi:MAG: histidinol-phosphate transaminase [Gammaproteobacteria bacterium]|nr:histidinol-phosphate transaminase [Gammaproteobacteria bacterium]